MLVGKIHPIIWLKGLRRTYDNEIINLSTWKLDSNCGSSKVHIEARIDEK